MSELELFAKSIVRAASSKLSPITFLSGQVRRMSREDVDQLAIAYLFSQVKTRKTDEWLRGIAETMGLTIEELATRYELEDHGASTMHSLEGGFGMRQTWHLKPRKTTDQSRTDTSKGQSR